MNGTVKGTTLAALACACGTLTCACGTLGCSESRIDREGLPGYNLVVIVVDTLRADHLGFGGYARDTSPFLDSVAAEGVVFERALATSSYTRESISSLLTGRLPSMSGSMGWNAAPSEELAGLGELYERSGYRTGFFTTTLMLGDERYTRGFDEIERLAEKSGLSGESHRLTERALDFVAGCDDESFMLYLHYLDPHGPYEPPVELRERIGASVHPDPIRLYLDLRREVPEFVDAGFGPGEARFEDMVARYDAEISDLDNALRALFDGLKAAGRLDRTLVVLTADHGEEFLEHGFIEHAWTLYDESIHVPLVFWAPDELSTARIDTPVSHVDILPTVTRLMDVPHDPRLSDGVPLFDESGRPAPSTRPIVSELLIQHRCVVRSATLGQWKYIQARRWLTPGERSEASQHERQLELAAREVEFDTWGEIVREELFDLAQDPRETKNLLATEPERAADMRAILLAHEQRSRRANADQQGAPRDLDEEERQRLEELGYL